MRIQAEPDMFQLYLVLVNRMTELLAAVAVSILPILGLCTMWKGGV